MSEHGQVARRMLQAEHFVMRTRGEPFSLGEFAHALHLPLASAHAYIGWLREEGVILRYDHGVYCMTLAYRNFLTAVAPSLAFVQPGA